MIFDICDGSINAVNKFLRAIRISGTDDFARTAKRVFLVSRAKAVESLFTMASDEHAT